MNSDKNIVETRPKNINEPKKQSPVHMKSTPNMLSVVEEQSNDESIVHILPRVQGVDHSTGALNSSEMENDKPASADTIPGSTSKSVISSSNFTSNTELNRTNETEKENLFDAQKLKGISSMPDDANINLSLSEKIDAIHKKSLDPTKVTSKTVNEKLKKATNPSISSLRAISAQTNNNHGTVSSASTTLTKGSTRAEIFAAKLHDAIKKDTNLNNDTVETFVYDTITSNTTPLVETNYENFEPLQDDTEKSKIAMIDTEVNDQKSPKTLSTAEIRANSDGKSSSNILPNFNPAKEKLQSVFKPEPASPVSRKTLDDNFEVKSRSSLGSKKMSRRKPSRTFGDFTDIHPMSKLEGDDNKSVNQLRQITSRLFDNKSIQPHKYSMHDDEYVNNDSFDDDMDYLDDPNYTNLTYNNNDHPHQANTPGAFHSNKGYGQNVPPGTHYEVLYSSTGPDDADEDELQSYLSMNYNHGIPVKPSFLGKSHQQHHLHNNSINMPDYGSIPADKKRMFWHRKNVYSSPHDFTSLRAQRMKQVRSFCYSISIIMLLLFLGFISGFVLATNKELQDLEVLDIRNAIVSQEELVFDMEFSAFNPSLMSIKIDTAQLDVFAKTQYALSGAGGKRPYETILLGTIETLEVPLIFDGGFLNRKKNTCNTQFKIVNPCSLDDGSDKNANKGKENKAGRDHRNHGDASSVDDSNGYIEDPLFFGSVVSFTTPDDRWLNISRHPFDLIVRGALLYKLPFSSENHTVSISYTAYIDPTDDFIGLTDII
jgi:hypothetical protein